MKPIVDVASATVVWNTVVALRFTNGVRGILDLRDVAKGPLFDELKRTGQLERFKVDPGLGTLVWPNGADIAPETLLNAVRSYPGALASARSMYKASRRGASHRVMFDQRWTRVSHEVRGRVHGTSYILTVAPETSRLIGRPDNCFVHVSSEHEPSELGTVADALARTLGAANSVVR